MRLPEAVASAPGEAVGLYHMVLEGVVFTAGQLALLDLVDDRLPGLREGTELVLRDERWHVGFGARCLADLDYDEAAILDEGERAAALWAPEYAERVVDGLRSRLRAVRRQRAALARMRVDGVELECEEIAGAEPALVFLHEGLGSVALWRDFPARLAAATGRRALIYSRAGHGQSDVPAVPRTPRFMHEEALDVLPELLRVAGIENPVLVGHSDGGSIALIHASAHPVSGLVLLAPHVFVEDVSVASIEEARETFETTDLRERMGRYHRDAERTFRLWNDIWLAPEFRSWNIEDVLASGDRAGAADPGRARPVRHARADRRDRARRRAVRSIARGARLPPRAAPRGAGGDAGGGDRVHRRVRMTRARGLVRRPVRAQLRRALRARVPERGRR